MRSIIRLVAAGALALPLTIGAAGIASADVEFDHESVSASAYGAFIHTVASGAEENGDSYYVEQFLGASQSGAGTFLTAAWTHDGSAGFFEEWSFSGPHGAIAGETSASADGHNGHHGDGHHGNGHDGDGHHGDGHDGDGHDGDGHGGDNYDD